MPKINSFRLVNIDYDNKNKKINDLFIEMNGKNANLLLANGSGKTFIISLLFQTIYPGHIDAEGRNFNDMLKDIDGTCHIAMCHLLDNGEKLITGFTAKKTDRIVFYNYILRLENNYSLSDIKYLDENKVVKNFEDFKNYIELNKTLFKTEIYTENLKYKYRNMLESYKIFKIEWEMMSKTNTIEGGISELLGEGEKKKASDLLSKFIIPNIKFAIKKDKNKNEILESFIIRSENLKKIPDYEQQIKNTKDLLYKLESQLNKLKVIKDQEENKDKIIYTMYLINETLHKDHKNIIEELNSNNKLLEEKKKKSFYLETQKKELINSNNLYKYKNLLEEEKSIKDNLDFLQTKIQEIKNILQLIKILDLYKNYKNYKSKIILLETQKNQKITDKEKNIRLSIISSKLFDYYNVSLEETKITLEDTRNELNEVEKKLKNSLDILNQKKYSQKEINKIIISVTNIKKELNTLGNLEELINLENDLINLRNQIEQITNSIEKIKNDQIETSYLIKTLEKELSSKLTDKEISVTNYNNYLEDYTELKNIKKYKEVNNSELLHVKLEQEIRRKTNELFLTEKDISDIEIILNQIKTTKNLPINNTIKRLDKYLIEKEFYDFTTGLDYMKENNYKNPILYNSIIIDKKNIALLNKKLKNFNTREDTIFILTREDLEKDYNIEENILNYNISILMNEFYSFISGRISPNDYIEKLKTSMTYYNEKKDSQINNLKESENLLNIVKSFFTKYTKDEEEHKIKLENIINEQTREINNLEICIQENKNKLEELNKEKNKHETLLKEENKIKIKKQKLSIKVQNISYNLIQNYNIDLSQINEFIEKKENENTQLINTIETINKTVKENEKSKKTLNTLIEELLSIASDIKNKKNNYLFNGNHYKNENIEQLKEEYEGLSREFDVSNIEIRIKEYKNELDNLDYKIQKSNFTKEILEKKLNKSYENEENLNEELNYTLEEKSALSIQLGKIQERSKNIKNKISNFNSIETNNIDFNKNIKKLDEQLNEIEKSIPNIQQNINTLEKKEASQSKTLEHQKTLLKDYIKPEKKQISDLNVFNPDKMEQNFDLAYSKIINIDKEIYQLKEILNEDWNYIKSKINEESFDLTLNITSIFEHKIKDILYDYDRFKETYNIYKKTLSNHINMVEKYKKNAEKDKNNIITNILNEISIYKSSLEKLTKRSRIKLEDKYIKTVDLVFNNLTDEECKENINEYINDLIISIKDKETNEANKILEKSLSIHELLKSYNGGSIKIRIYKPTSSLIRKLYPWENVNSWSGGEKFFAFFCVYISLVLTLRQNHSDSMVIISDNPFGKASSEHILTPLISLMKDNNVQFITFTAHTDENLSKYFDYKYSLVLLSNRNKEFLKKKENIKNTFFEKGYYSIK